MRPIAILTLLVLVFATVAYARTFAFASYYQSHMVLQRAPQRSVVWGNATAGDEISLMFDNNKYTVTTSAQGFWRVMLPPTGAGGPYEISATDGSTTISITDVLFGDVWVCGGQSNMQMTVSSVYNATAEIAAGSNYPNIRVFTVGLYENQLFEQVDLSGILQNWTAAPTGLGGAPWSTFSAACWFFGRNLYDNLQVPLGLVANPWGGTIIQVWETPQAMAKCGLPTSAPARSGAFEAENDFALASSPGSPNAASYFPTYPSGLWNAMVAPLLNLTIKGAIWYQGESNVGDAGNYSCLFPEMISEWRRRWSVVPETTEAVFPFGFVQLAGYCNCCCTGGYNNCSIPGIVTIADLRWAQTANLGEVPNAKLPNVFDAVAMDLADPNSPDCDVHPRAKQQVGERLARGALQLAYAALQTRFHGPFPRLIHLISEKAPYTVQVQYDHADSGLVFNNLTGPMMIGFEVHTNTGGWVPAQVVEVHQNELTLVAPELPDQLRYAYRNNPCLLDVSGTWVGSPCLIYNRDGLPGATFNLPISK